MLASPDSFLGQLQRGSGSGFLRALQEDLSVVRPLLLNCITHDPRWDSQLETRGDYYAALILQLPSFPLDPLDAYLHASSESDQYDSEELVLDTLCPLALQGNISAIAILRAYLTYGQHWNRAFETFALSIDEVSRTIDQRFPDNALLDEALFYAGALSNTEQEPWPSLRIANPRVNFLLIEHDRRMQQRQQEEKQLQARFAHLPTPELFTAPTDHRTTLLAAQALQNSVTTADLALLLHMAQEGEHQQRLLAFRGLQRLADPAALPILCAFFQSPAAQPGYLYGAAVRAIIALPPDLTLDLARTWFDAPDGPHHHVALQLLNKHATSVDVQRVRDALLPSLSRDTWGTNECYMQCSMLEILARFPQFGPYPEAEIVFKEAKYARARIPAAKVLASSNPHQFANNLAFECLWDCEDDVRLIGCKYVSLDLPGAYTRLQALSHDPYQDLRDTAKERISTAKAFSPEKELL